jgi:hypothetical protein
MIVYPVLRNKIIRMAEAVGEETLAAQQDHFYERGVLEDFLQYGEIGIAEAIDVITYLRTLTDQDAPARRPT